MVEDSYGVAFAVGAPRTVHTQHIPCRPGADVDRCAFTQRAASEQSTGGARWRSLLGACAGFCAGRLAVSRRRSRNLLRRQSDTSAPAVAAPVTGECPVPVWVVNLDRDAKRWEETCGELETHNVQAERFPATLGKALSDEELAEKVTWGARYFCTPGMIGCFLSHQRAWRRVIEEDHEAVIVLEDDVVLRPDFNKRLKTVLADLPEDWEVCLIGALGVVNVEKEDAQMRLFGAVAGGTIPCPGETRSVSEHLFVPFKPTGTHAYMVSKRGAANLLEKLPRARYHVDLSAWSLPGLKLYCPKEFLATQRFDGTTTVSKEGDPLTKRFLMWTLQVTGIVEACRKGGVEDVTWAWKVAIFAIPVPFLHKKRFIVELGPATAFWVVMLLLAAIRRSFGIAAFAIGYQGAIACMTQWLSGTFRRRLAAVAVLATASVASLGRLI